MNHSSQHETTPVRVGGVWIEAIVGYRSWRSGGGKLRSVVKGNYWPEHGAPRALCTPHRLVSDHVYGPEQGCKCGYFAFKHPVLSFQHFPANHFYHGQIAMWGKVFEHELGYRSQYAKVIALYETPESQPGRMDVVAEMADGYDVPILQRPTGAPGPFLYYNDRG